MKINLMLTLICLIQIPMAIAMDFWFATILLVIAAIINLIGAWRLRKE
jgi:hypothetical protein